MDNKNRTFGKASFLCNDLHKSRIIEINSKEENIALAAFAKKELNEDNLDAHIWLSVKKKDLTWGSGAKVKYNNFNSGKSVGDSAIFELSTGKWKWTDGDEAERKIIGVVCEKAKLNGTIPGSKLLLIGGITGAILFLCLALYCMSARGRFLSLLGNIRDKDAKKKRGKHKKKEPEKGIRVASSASKKPHKGNLKSVPAE